jgi:hypothetical protein
MAEAGGGEGDRRKGGLAVWGCLVVAGLVPASADRGRVAVQAVNPQLLAGRGEWPSGMITAAPASAAIPAPVPSTTYQRWRASTCRHRSRPVA